MSDSARWNLTVSRRTDHALRTFLASEGVAGRGRLSRFVEEAVQSYILERAAGDAKQNNMPRTHDEIIDAVEQALEWARRN